MATELREMTHVQLNIDIPIDAVGAFAMAWRLKLRGVNGDGVLGGWFYAHTEGVITVRDASMKRWPEHDKDPSQKERHV